jgi:hypothetical protein
MIRSSSSAVSCSGNRHAPSLAVFTKLRGTKNDVLRTHNSDTKQSLARHHLVQQDVKSPHVCALDICFPRAPVPVPYNRPGMDIPNVVSGFSDAAAEIQLLAVLKKCLVKAIHRAK